MTTSTILTTTHFYETVNTTNRTLKSLNDEKASLFAPVIAIFGVLMLFGITGNILVCYIYGFKFKKIPSNYFILCLAFIDLLSCFIGMPFEISDLLFPLTYEAPAACKIFRFVESVTIGASGVTLVIVAFDRYYKLCKPLKAFPLRKARVLCFISLGIGVFFSWPTLLMYGKKTVDTSIRGLQGYECSIDDSVGKTIYPTLYYGTHFMLFLVCVVMLAILYSMTGFQLYRRKHKTIGEKLPGKVHTVSTSSISSPADSSFTTVSTNVSQIDITEGDAEKSNQTVTQQNIKKPHKSKAKQMMGKLSINTKKMTAIFVSITILFVLTFLPYVSILILRALKVAFHDEMSPATELWYNLGVRSYFLNNSLNPLIYGVMNKPFRDECSEVFKKIVGGIFFCRRRN